MNSLVEKVDEDVQWADEDAFMGIEFVHLFFFLIFFWLKEKYILA